MAKVVTITANADVVVISERVGDRERYQNGVDYIKAGEQQDFIIHEGQTLRVEAAPEPKQPAPQEDGEGA